MSIKTVKFRVNNIDDTAGFESVMTALKNIDGVKSAEVNPIEAEGSVSYDDTDTSIHAIEAALNTVDYITQAFPVDAPQNPKNM